MSKLPQIPGYRVIKKLGQGGMADVYLGVQEKLQRNVAIKVMVPALFRDELFSKRFIKEAQTAAQLIHPNIITIHDVGEAEDSHFIVMEYLEETLSDRLALKGSIPVGEALEIVKMIAGALDYAHKKGFIHRDIKPDNIMFRADGTVVLVDFGIARAMDSSTQLTRTGMSIGTPHYMSPEQCKGEKIDGRSDIYSLGVQLYEMLTGEVPYNAENTAGIIIKQIQDPVPRLPETLNRYQFLIDKMMAKNRDKRIQSGSELIHFIDGLKTAQAFMPPPSTLPEETIILEEPTMQTAVPPTVGLPTTTRLEGRERKKWLVPGIAAAVVVVVVAVLIYFITRPPQEDINKTGPPPIQEKQEPSQEKEVENKDTATPGGETQETKSPGEEQPPIEKKTAADKTTEKPAKTIDPTSKPAEKQKTIEPVVKKEPQRTVPKVKTVTLLGLSPDTLQTYNRLVQQIRIPVLQRRLQVHGQVTVDLLIDEKGKIVIESLNEMLTVNPPLAKQHVIKIIKHKIEVNSLPPPRDKQNKPVKFKWRLTYKVGKLGNTIFLTKQ